MIINFPCKICCKPVAKNHDSIRYNKCDTWVHRNCNKVNKQTYRLLQKDKSSHWFCIICTKDLLPFSDLNNDEFIHTIKGKKVKFTQVSFSKLIPISMQATKHYLPSDFKQIKMDVKNNFNFFHLNFPPSPIISPNYTPF